MARAYERLAPESSNEFGYVKSVGVIGAGVAGLQMARACLAHGLKVTVFDKAPKVGGLWQENYHSFGVQVPKEFYEFPDFPMTTVPWGGYATGPQTQAYIESYAEHFKLLPHCRLHTEVQKLEKRKDRKGYVFHLKNPNGSQTTEEFDFLVVATGMYSQVHNLPDWAKSPGSFKGQIVHSSKYIEQSLARGKKVLVIGSGKSAIDIAVSTSEVASEPPTMLYREAHWHTPRYIAGLVPFQFVFLSRFGQTLVSWYKGAWPAGAPWLVKPLSYLMFPIMWAAFRVVELIFAIQGGQWGDYRPKLDVVADFYGYAHVLDTTFLNKWRAGKLKGKKGEVKELLPNGVRTVAGDVIEADLIISATGFRKTYDYLPAEVRTALNPEKDGLWLYRHMIPSSIRDLSLAFCGSEVATISNIKTHGIHAEYIARVLAGRVVLPEASAMAADVEHTKAWKRSWMPETASRANYVLLHQIHYHDQLLRDMGINESRKCCCCGGECFCPYMPKDYDGVMTPMGKESA